MWFDTWQDVIRVGAVGTAGYLTLVLFLRISGKRTLAKLNAFDFIVTVALGSILATILLNASVTWAEGAAALLTLVALQFVVAAVTSRRPAVRDVVTAGPTLLMWRGEAREDAMRRHRVSMAEVRQAVRSSGTGDVSAVAAVVLETDGTVSVISDSQAGDGSALQEVVGVPGAGR